MSNLKDVAKLAKVSTATVSRVLTNKGNVTAENKRKVMEAVKELNYHPNILGRQLRTMETKTILVVVPDITNTFFSNVLRGIESIAMENGYQVLLGDTQNRIESEYFNHLYYKKVDGAILLTARTDPQVLNMLFENYPIVLACEFIEGAEIPTINIDNISGAQQMTNHLISLGHERIAHITGPLDGVLGRDRLKGYRKAMAHRHLETPDELIVEGNFSFDSGYHLMEKLLNLKNPPTSVFAANDEMAIGAIKSIKANNLSVPEDIAVVGFDGIQMSTIVEPALTTFSQPTFEIGSNAMELLICLLRKERLEEKQVILNGRTVIRESCGYRIQVNDYLKN
ncbi:LacI family DNA-binding transcriptional regulator [Scopulibacillus cellulosilyticus]|uniref:LacI family DNA-binding transcriptional regulator n=1 Tax=Scopulibacillus cellulosilyticus TaxID=2665665 RepID=A0ABW2PQD4_9BACL